MDDKHQRYTICVTERERQWLRKQPGTASAAVCSAVRSAAARGLLSGERRTAQVAVSVDPETDTLLRELSGPGKRAPTLIAEAIAWAARE